MKIEKLVIPAIAELTHAWTTVFGFTHLDESLRQELRSLNMVVFPASYFCWCIRFTDFFLTGSEKIGHEDDDFIHTKMGNRSDMVLVDGILCSKSHSEEMETACSDPCSAENLENKCHSFTAMNWILSEENIILKRTRNCIELKLVRYSPKSQVNNISKRIVSLKKSSKKKEEVKKATTTPNLGSKDHKVPRVDELARRKSAVPRVDEINDGLSVNKRQRTPTFNQLTGPYHEPFCLDIFISKASVRACVVHRVTSKVVSVAHSISKDIKFDLASTKNKTTCAAVGAILAQRALGDDIHDVIYTPRKGERVEGKLQIVLQSIIDNGINVKVKIKQRPKKPFNRIT
ncbi:uncharacterized protein HKW66_Vig0163650 [Vigna angularis]|uniref:Increased DNA methylation 1 C-terminal domain-containing protein n=1 Tax=Phaseolus angularis TaxID=3914 RepID=A0A8T0JHR5_PHAAN|nr:uncharacterized protein HKW66_Vig0163650 [Vigna angularis]